MRTRVLCLAAALGLVVASLIGPTLAASSCEECVEDCRSIPMDPEDCLQLYCPECAGTSSPAG